MNILSYLNGFIMDSAINASGNGFFCWWYKCYLKVYLKENMELLSKLTSNDTSKFGIIPSVSNNHQFNRTMFSHAQY